MSEPFKESKRTKTKPTWSFLKKNSSTSEDEIVIQRQESPELKKTSSLENKEVSSKNRSSHELVFDEIIRTELAFNDRLDVLIKCSEELENAKKGDFFNFINEKKPLNKESGVPRNGLKQTGQDVLNELFNQAKHAKNYSNVLLGTLKDCASFKEKTKVLAGLTFDNFRVMIKAYEQYTTFQQRLRSSEREKFFKKTDALIPLEEKQSTRLNFEGFASVLMQRLSRYALLMGELLKKTKENPELKEEIDSLEIAYNRAKEASEKSNKALHKSIRSFDFEPEMSQTVIKPKKEQVDHLLKTLFSLSTESLNSFSDSEMDSQSDTSSEGKRIEN